MPIRHRFSHSGRELRALRLSLLRLRSEFDLTRRYHWRHKYNPDQPRSLRGARTAGNGALAGEAVAAPPRKTWLCRALRRVRAGAIGPPSAKDGARTAPSSSRLSLTAKARRSSQNMPRRAIQASTNARPSLFPAATKSASRRLTRCSPSASAARAAISSPHDLDAVRAGVRRADPAGRRAADCRADDHHGRSCPVQLDVAAQRQRRPASHHGLQYPRLSAGRLHQRQTRPQLFRETER